jgi:hypothetical protein
MSVRRAVALVAVLAVCLIAAGCGGSAQKSPQRHHAAAGVVSPAASDRASPITWTGIRRVAGIVDLAGPTPAGAITAAAHGRLEILPANGMPLAFAPAYSANPLLEPYIALSSGQGVTGAGCSWPAGYVYALRLTAGHGITAISPQGKVRRFIGLRVSGLEDGIAFDRTGRFGHRLLVTMTAHARTTVFAIACNGAVQVVTRSAPRVEGGMLVTPRSFGRFGGDLLAPDEVSGNLYAIAPDGRSSLVVRSGVPHGPDIGIESLGLVPSRFRLALVSDRRTPHNPHPGDNLLLAVTHAALAAAGVRAGELIAVSEGGAATVAIGCATTCNARYIGAGPHQAHIEGHVIFTMPG